MTAGDVLGRVDELTDGTGGSVDAVMGAAIGPYRKSRLNGEIDDTSRQGAFGYEYFGQVPRRRWLITKLDLLVAQAIGYRLRQTSAFVPLSITTTSLAQGMVSQPYLNTLQAAGGIPFYNWTIDSGALPDGLSLDPFAGTISGTPTTAGTFTFRARVQEYVEGSTGVTATFGITIQ